MFKQKITARAICDDCGATRKEQSQHGEGFDGIVKRLRSKGWHIPDDPDNEGCYCPTCAEQRDHGGGAA